MSSLIKDINRLISNGMNVLLVDILMDVQLKK